ncbi:MAG TPA: alkaline phosphatase family protein, partial [Streptosporangiaceae bacterium]
SPADALTCDQNHAYQAEQLAFDNLSMDMFVQFTDHDTCTGQPTLFGTTGLAMDYFDGNTVTALWNYAQNYAMSDNNYDTNFGPSTPGALNLISGDDGGGFAVSPATGQKESDPGSIGSVGTNGVGTVYGDLDPAYDDCSDGGHTSTNPVGVMTGRNIGNLLNARNITWGWFQGGFVPSSHSGGFSVCGASSENIGGVAAAKYSPHHNPFEYYASTANPKHLAPTSEAEIGMTDRANHQYDLSLFYKTLQDGNMPAVSFLKAAEAQDAHPGYSDPLDEQKFIVNTVNAIEKSKFWASTAIVITYDDSDGWYDHQPSPIVNGSNDSTLDNALCEGHTVGLGGRNDRCGFGPRLPLVVISPYTRQNYVSHNLTNQASVITFIEDNWLNGQRAAGGSFDSISGSLDAANGVLDTNVKPHLTPVILNPNTGEVVSG